MCRPDPSGPGRVLLTLATLLAACLMPPALAAADARAPRIFYSDLVSGPATGGENNNGAYVTVYGTGFGESRGSSEVRVGGAPVAGYRAWSNSRITVQLGPRAATGDIVVQSPAGASNGIPFTVRSGKIYFVAANGNDSHAGTFAAPWRTLPHAVQTIAAGDTVYAMDGVVAAVDDGQGWEATLVLRRSWCSPNGPPRALIAYPGATVTIGNAGAKKPASGLRTTDFSGGGGACEGNWVFAGLRFRGLSPVSVNGPSSGWRFVANDISCPNADGNDGGGACFMLMLASHVQLYGNVVHDAGTAQASALFHGIYFSSDTNHIDMGWNTVANIHGCRGIQVHSSPLGVNFPSAGLNQFDIAIHDNLIHDIQCDAITLDTIDPSKGPVRIYNNVIYRAGIGPNNPQRTGGWSCIYVRASTEKGSPGSGTVDIDNNTLYGCGTFAEPPYTSANAAIVTTGRLAVRLRNNVIVQTASSLHKSGVPYLVVWVPGSKPDRVCSPADRCPWIQGSNNLFFGAGPPPNTASIVNSLSADPQFVDGARFDLHLRPSSPARRKGVNNGLTTDADGKPRGPADFDIGAFQLD